MNIDPQLYDNNNSLQKKDANELLSTISDAFRNRKVKKVVDIGCGTGNITTDILQFTNCDELIAFDKSESMITFAEQHYKCDKISFKVGDICDNWTKLKDDIKLHEQTDAVFSIHCLHWIKDNDKAMAIENISKMLKPGGSCYIVMFFWSDILPLQEQITHFPKWNKFFAHLENPDINEKNLVPGRQRRRSSAPFPVYSRTDEQGAIEEWKNLCSKSGLNDNQIFVKKTSCFFDDFTGFRDEVTSLCHFLNYIPEPLKQEFLDDYFKHVRNCYTNNQKILPKVELRYECLIIIAEKVAD